MQGVIFSHGVVGGEERSSRVYLVDERSTNNCPLSFSDIPGRTRRYFYDLVPPAYIKRESVTWCYDEGYFERERYGDRKIDLFEVGSSYTELRERERE